MLSTMTAYGDRYHVDTESSMSLTISRSARRGPWLPEEDQALLQLVRTQGANNWVRISQQLQHRSPKQCRERYHQNLKPSLKHDPISAQEGEVIERLVQEMGKRWAEIARRLGNRSDNAVKNWWNGSVNRRRRNPAHSTTGFKQMGSRLQPVPFTLHPEANYSQRSRTNFRTSDNRSVATYVDQREVASSYKPSLPQVPDTIHNRTFPDPNHSPKSPLDTQALNSISSVATSEHTMTKTRPSVPKVYTSEIRSELPPLRSSSLHLPHGDRLNPVIERSPISPALSDTSQRQAPSLISDNQSMYSISPRTVSTPRPGLPAPVEIAHSVWSDTQSSIYSSNHHILYTPSSLSDHRAKLVAHVPYNSALQRCSIITNEDRLKDSRMNVSTLLQ